MPLPFAKGLLKKGALDVAGTTFRRQSKKSAGTAGGFPK
jgi:hypothetical protein